MAGEQLLDVPTVCGWLKYGGRGWWTGREPKWKNPPLKKLYDDNVIDGGDKKNEDRSHDGFDFSFFQALVTFRWCLLNVLLSFPPFPPFPPLPFPFVSRLSRAFFSL